MLKKLCIIHHKYASPNEIREFSRFLSRSYLIPHIQHLTEIIAISNDIST